MKNTVSDYMQAEELQKFIEKEVLNLIKNLAEQEGMTKEKVQNVARRTLELIHPGMKLDDTEMQLNLMIIVRNWHRSSS